MTDRQLPEHLEQMVTDLKNSRCGKTRSQGNPLAAKLRTILAAAWALADGPINADCMSYGRTCACCGAERQYGAETPCAADCPHRQLKEALADD